MAELADRNVTESIPLACKAGPIHGTKRGCFDHFLNVNRPGDGSLCLNLHKEDPKMAGDAIVTISIGETADDDSIQGSLLSKEPYNEMKVICERRNAREVDIRNAMSINLTRKTAFLASRLELPQMLPLYRSSFQKEASVLETTRITSTTAKWQLRFLIGRHAG